MHVSDESLYKLLLDNGYVERDLLDQAVQHAKREKISFYESIIAKDILSDENLGKLIADELNYPFIRLSKISIPRSILAIVPESFAKQFKIILFDLQNGEAKVATSQPENTLVLTNLSKKINCKLKVFFSTERDIAQATSLYKKELQKVFDQLIHEQIEEAGIDKSGDVPVIKIVETLIDYAFAHKASDIHIEPKKEYALVRYRIDGILEDVLNVPLDIYHRIVTRIKIASSLKTDEHLSAQDGKMKVALEQEDLDVRVSIVPIVLGEKIVLRLLSSSSRQFGLSDLGMLNDDLKKVKDAIEKPYGMILSTGPTGSGKSTTMYALIKLLNTREKNIATIEDPVEYDIQDINQIQVNEKTNLTFAEGLRSILRQDPDIIYVGEIRDSETADIAINSAMTGHLVLSTLHTNDAATALPRLMDMNIEPFLVASTVNVIIAQRLVRKICEKCKVSYAGKMDDLKNNISEDELLSAFGKFTEIRLYKGKGCQVCRGTGYSGRVGIFEVMVITDPLRDLIMKRAEANVITKKAIREGMTTMIQDGLKIAQHGVTTIGEVLRVTKEEI